MTERVELAELKALFEYDGQMIPSTADLKMALCNHENDAIVAYRAMSTGLPNEVAHQQDTTTGAPPKKKRRISRFPKSRSSVNTRESLLINKDGGKACHQEAQAPRQVFVPDGRQRTHMRMQYLLAADDEITNQAGFAAADDGNSIPVESDPAPDLVEGSSGYPYAFKYTNTRPYRDISIMAKQILEGQNPGATSDMVSRLEKTVRDLVDWADCAGMSANPCAPYVGAKILIEVTAELRSLTPPDGLVSFYLLHFP
jgi:hypothetical protein